MDNLWISEKSLFTKSIPTQAALHPTDCVKVTQVKIAIVGKAQIVSPPIGGLEVIVLAYR